MLKVWGRKNSINVQKVLWCCGELDLAYERTDVGGPFGGNRDPEYLRLNPNGLVPAISDDGFGLWESNVIVRYLAAKHGAPLCPQNLQQRAEAEKWMDWQLGTLWARMRPVFIGLIRTPPEERDDEAIESFRQQTIESWSLVEAHLEDRNYVLGETFTMADIPLGVSIHRWNQLPIERPSTPNLDAYYQRLMERPVFEKTVSIPLS